MSEIELPPAPTNVALDRKLGSLAVQISNAAVQVYRAHTGRGPTRSWTSIDPNLIVVELRDTLTTGERNLVAAGQLDTVMKVRRAYRHLLHQPLVDAVEHLAGRRVLALLGDCQLDPDLAVEVFILASEA